MDAEQFEEVMQAQFQICQDVLCEKGVEYATVDRLHNFRVAAELQGVSMQKALAGMLAKHTVSIYDMCNADTMPEYLAWDEKITDHINYLILLKAMVVDYETNHRKFENEVEAMFHDKGRIDNA